MLIMILTTQSGVSVAVGHSVIAACRLTRLIRLITEYVPAETKQSKTMIFFYRTILYIHRENDFSVSAFKKI